MAAFRAIGVFCFFGALCALYAAITLAWPGTALDALWAVNPTGHASAAAAIDEFLQAHPELLDGG